MRNISSTVLALAAMVLSSATTYLTFFDARYTLTSTVAKLEGQANTGFSSNDSKRSVNYRFWMDASVVVSNRGTRALVISEISAVKSNKLDTCSASSDAKRIPVQQYMAPDFNRTEQIQPFIVEPGSVNPISLSMGLSDIDQEVEIDEAFKLDPVHELWCLEWKIFDPNGRKHENMMPAFIMDVNFVTEEGDRHPTSVLKWDIQSKPTELLTRGLF